MPSLPTFDEYVGTLGRLSAHIDPTSSTPEAVAIKDAARVLAGLDDFTLDSVVAWLMTRPRDALVLGLTVGLTQERLKNALKDRFDTSGLFTLAKQRPADLVTWLDEEFDLLRSLRVQAARSYEFGDVLVARGGSRVIAQSAGTTGRKVEDELEAIVRSLELPYAVRTRFVGRGGLTAPADIVIPSTEDALIAVAAKGFDSTGSKLTDAVREVQEMATVRRPTQFIMAVIDGIGWKSRIADLQRIYGLWAAGEIDGMYTLATLDAFREDLDQAARVRHLRP